MQITRNGKITLTISAATIAVTMVWSFATDYAAVKASVMTAQTMVTNARELNLQNQGALERRLTRIEEKVDRLIERGK
jgi:HJR/Mrr/RecB family endonuclease